jgi:2-polyprenyl-3-methyl-5-hydroxy-6-metoxy-1,4-benzoquinol methylase
MDNESAINEIDAYKGRVYAEWVNEALIGMISDSDEDILDVGCGSGANAKELLARKKRVKCVSASEQEAAVVRAAGLECLVADCNVALPLESGQFDVILLSHVLEHLAWPEHALTQLKPLLKSGGSIIAAVPNVMFFRCRLRMLQGHFPRESVGVFDETHLRWFTWYTPKLVARLAGMRVSEQHGDAWFRDIPWLPRRVGRILVRLRPNLFSQQIRFRLRDESR